MNNNYNYTLLLHTHLVAVLQPLQRGVQECDQLLEQRVDQEIPCSLYNQPQQSSKHQGVPHV